MIVFYHHDLSHLFTNIVNILKCLSWGESIYFSHFKMRKTALKLSTILGYEKTTMACLKLSLNHSIVCL